MKKFTLGVYGIYCAPAGAPAPAFDLRAMFDPRYPYSFIRYWRDVTAGTREIDAEVHNWVNIGTADEAVTAIDGTDAGTDDNPRHTGASNAVEFLTDEFPKSPPSGFDGLVVFVTTTALTADLATPPAAGGGTAVLIGGKWCPTAYLNLGGSFNFYAHEIGHVLGYGHSSGPLHSVDQWGTYDNPVDIMSAMSFGRTDPTFPVPAAKRRFAHPILWGGNRKGAGPGMSPAELWRFSASSDNLARFTAPDVPWVHKLPAGAAPTLVKLYRAGTPMVDLGIFDIALTTLVAMPSSDPEPYWTTFEYRPASGWDRGLGHGPGLTSPGQQRPSPGVVVHRILRDDGAPNDGPVDRVNYRHTVSLPGGDLDWSDGRAGVRVIDQSPDAVLLLVGSRLPRIHEVKLTLHPPAEINHSQEPGETVTISGVGASCGTGKFQMEWHSCGYVVRTSAQYSGFASPVLRYVVNGITIPNWVDPSDPNTSAAVPLTIDVPVQVPVSRGVTQTVTKSIDIVAHFNRHEASFTIPKGDGVWNLAVTVNVAESSSKPVIRSTATADVELTTLSYSLPVAAVEAQGACLRTIADEVRQLPPEKIDIVNPKFVRELVNERRFAELGPVFKSLFELQLTMPSAASGLIADTAARLGIQPADMRRIGSALRRIDVRGNGVAAERSSVASDVDADFSVADDVVSIETAKSPST